MHFMDQMLDDRELVERIERAIAESGVLGDATRVKVLATNGVVLLTGQIMGVEVDPLLEVVRAVPGVKRVDDDLDAFGSERGLPELQVLREVH